MFKLFSIVAALTLGHNSVTAFYPGPASFVARKSTTTRLRMSDAKDISLSTYTDKLSLKSKHVHYSVLHRRIPCFESHSSPASLMSANQFCFTGPSDTAFVFIEFQNEFTSPGGKLYDAVKDTMDQYDTIANAQKVLTVARNAGCTIIHAPIEFEPGHREINGEFGILANVKAGEAFTAKTWNSDFCDAMKPAPTDLVVKGKTGLCGFHSTNLDFLLRQNHITNVVLSGFLTNCCVESTMRTAYENGYKVFTLKDCCGATSIAGHEAAFEHTFGMFSIPTTSEEIMNAIQTPIAVV
jgi:nicotinamidase-related amidase